MITRKALIILTLAATGTLFLTACEDETAKANEELAQSIRQARHDYTAAAAGDTSRGDLSTVAGKLATVGSSPAAALLEASARLDLASRHVDEAAQLERQNRALRSTVRAMAAAAGSLNGVAVANGQFDPSESEAILEAAISEIQGRLSQAQQAISALEGPVDNLRAQSAADAEEASRLQAEARELRDQAFDAGDFAGHPLITQAVERDGEADALEAAIMQRDIELIERSSQLNWARLQKETLEIQITEARKAQTDLGAASQAFTTNAGDLRTTLSGIQTKLGAALTTISENQSRLTTLYSECSAGLGKAVSGAERATGDAARTLKAKILQITGQMNRMNAIGLRDQAGLLQQLAGMGSAVGGSGYGAEATTASTAADQASQAAKAAFQQALDALPNANAQLRALLTEAAGG